MRNHPRRVGFVPTSLTRCERAPAQRPTIIYNSPDWCELWRVGCVFTNLLLIIMHTHTLALSLSHPLSLSIYLITYTYYDNTPLGSVYAWHYIMRTYPRERLSCNDATCCDCAWLYVESPPFYLNTHRDEGHARFTSNRKYIVTTVSELNFDVRLDNSAG